MNYKTVLVLSLLCAISFLSHGMKSSDVVQIAMADKTETDNKLSQITLPQTYHQLSQLLLPEIARHIFSFHLGGIDLKKLPREIEESCKDSWELALCINKLLPSCGDNLSVELFKKYFPHKKISICDIKRKLKYTVLHYAAGCNSIRCIKLSLDIADTNVCSLLTMKDSYNNTALHLVAKSYGSYCSTRIATKLLLDAAGDEAWNLLIMRDNTDRTALHYAAKSGRTDIVKLLLDAAGNKAHDYIAMKAEPGITAFDLATKETQEIMKSYQHPSFTSLFITGLLIASALYLSQDY